MDIQNKSVLVLGAWGLVGNAVTRKLVNEKPRNIIITSLKKEEAQEALVHLKKEFPDLPEGFFIPWWGNIFTRNTFKDEDRLAILEDRGNREIMIHDIMDELDDEILHNSALYSLIAEHKPDVIIDCINSATGIAYQDIYTTYRKIKKTISKNELEALQVETEKMLCSQYIPQLIRHVQILYAAMHESKTKIYVKIGTSGTGGMGLNIPYTHSEEKPSRVLLSKSSVAGAHTLLLFLMGRTPDGPITKEIKPTAAIGWKRIAFGEIKKKGRPIELLDVPLGKAITLNGKLGQKISEPFASSGETLKSVFIDTGENGIFSKGEFEAITAQGQMEFVTPEEIAADVIYEIKGGNTGHDIINALDNATMAPTYRAGYLQHSAVSKLANLEEQHNVNSIAFELLGPPRLSKLLHELNIISLICPTMLQIKEVTAKELSEEAMNIICFNPKLRSEILSIGIPILLSDGKQLLRGNEIKIPAFKGEDELDITQESIDHWAKEGWVDLRESNMTLWQNRIRDIINEAESIPVDDTSSMHVRNKDYWNNYEKIETGKIVSWLFIHEEKGIRMKA